MNASSYLAEPPIRSIHRCVQDFSSGKLSSAELCQQLFDRYRQIHSHIQGYLSLDQEAILRAAEASDQRRREGRAHSPFDGIPIAVKDSISVTDQPCTCASKLLENYQACYDATVIRSLKQAGLICCGRTNMDEFAMGSSTEYSAYQVTRNPWNSDYVPGGSSGGSAAVVASGQAIVALGSDTGGSIRQPASYCGLVGLKPSYGRVSRYGLVAFASSLDQIGPLTWTVKDAAILLDLIAGPDPKDATTVKIPYEPITETLETSIPSNMVIGIARDYEELDGISTEVQKTVQKAIAYCKELDCKIVDISLPHLHESLAVYYIIAAAEASSNLARFDGIRYGRRESADDLASSYLETRSRGFGKEVKRRILLGTFVLSSGYYDAYYRQAQKLRSVIRQGFQNAFESCDVIITPTAPTTAFPLASVRDPHRMSLMDICTAPVNLAGNCALSLPLGISSNHLPIGVQLIGDALQEKKILQLAYHLERLGLRSKKQPTQAGA